ncbi:YdeI/OmpD-associated family protein [Stenotrophomonas sp. MH1]|uniref:YdeI/OmpD-associated family protein n=1 Tax=Stenotrophomonas capsici TaxID=3110230 RepID=A0ABU5UYP9_9GAMM|nr:YdeI/OmpD-associated family protein [Stenotrophomonas sp. MH1]MEA5666208.1 YdeI/OmpD-associated family protein [Stenotrophomonas sp. MH1]
MSPDPRVDAYIANAADFAQPILREIRARVHAGCSQAEEAIKWGMPSFLYKGKLLCGMAAFKAHATLGFWQRQAGPGDNTEAMGQYGRLQHARDLPDKRAFAAQLREGMRRIDSGVKAPRRTPRAALPIPPAFAQALAAAPQAQAAFDGFAPGYQRDYLEWIGEAKRETTRQQRITQAIAWLSDGKHRNWKHEKH